MPYSIVDRYKGSYEMLVPICETTRRHMREDRDVHDDDLLLQKEVSCCIANCAANFTLH